MIFTFDILQKFNQNFIYNLKHENESCSAEAVNKYKRPTTAFCTTKMQVTPANLCRNSGPLPCGFAVSGISQNGGREEKKDKKAMS